MASVGNSPRLLTALSPMVQSVRHRTRAPNLRNPIPPHWLRAITLKVTKPPKLDPFRGPSTIEKYHKKKYQKWEREPGIEGNPFEKILAKEFLDRIERARLIAVCHRYPTDEHTRFGMKVTLKKSKMEYLHHNNRIVKYALMGTIYEAASCLYVADTCTIVSDEPSVGKLLKVEKKTPWFDSPWCISGWSSYEYCRNEAVCTTTIT